MGVELNNTERISIPYIQNKCLEKISRFDFLIDGQEDDEHAGPVQLEFNDGSVLEMNLMPDGESVDFTWKNKQIVEGEDKETDWFRIDLSGKESFNQFCTKRVTIGDNLLFGRIAEKKEDLVIAGYGFKFEDGQSLVYYNDGDGAKIFVNEMPPAFVDTFKLIWEKGVFEEIID